MRRLHCKRPALAMAPASTYLRLEPGWAHSPGHKSPREGRHPQPADRDRGPRSPAPPPRGDGGGGGCCGPFKSGPPRPSLSTPRRPQIQAGPRLPPPSPAQPGPAAEARPPVSRAGRSSLRGPRPGPHPGPAASPPGPGPPAPPRPGAGAPVASWPPRPGPGPPGHAASAPPAPAAHRRR